MAELTHSSSSNSGRELEKIIFALKFEFSSFNYLLTNLKNIKRVLPYFSREMKKRNASYKQNFYHLSFEK